MPTLPWTVARDAAPHTAVVFLASRLELRSGRHIPGFLFAALRVRKQVLRSPGAIGVSLIAQPARKTFWTLSAWTDEAALDRFVRTQPHLGTMNRFHTRLTHPTFVTWTAGLHSLPEPRGDARERWAEGKSRLAAQREQ